MLTDPPNLPDKTAQDKAFRAWQADSIAKVPVLGNAYALLVECWTKYHTDTK